MAFLVHELLWKIIKSFLFPLIIWIYLHAYEFEVKADEYEEILKYEVSSVYKEVNPRRKDFFWEMREVKGVMNVR